MSKNRTRSPQSSPPPPETDPIDEIRSTNWVTDRAWVSGATGAIAVLVFAAWYNHTEALRSGLQMFGWKITDNRVDTILAALILCTVIMVLVEFVRLWLRSPRDFIKLDPDVQNGQYFRFFVNTLANYLSYLAIFGLAILLYHSANEYGFHKKGAYYAPWFRFLDWAWVAYLWLGLPYCLITRALKYEPDSDRRDMTHTFGKVVRHVISVAPPLKHMRQGFNEIDKKVSRGLLVKLFFAPLMTVFFCDQFPHLVANVGYVFEGIPNAIANSTYTHNRFNSDFFNISIALVFSIDVALAWCGYVISSRWVNNQTVSAEPTLLGWLVCILCYPPFNQVLGWFYTAPGERAVLQFPDQWLITIFTGMMVLSYIVYVSATLWFGVRFSNLTNRGIIRKGPYAFVRHPAYASKNFAWWCVMFPAVIYNAAHTGIGVAAFQITGLLIMTGFYYLRAMTEERHLMADPYYQVYCQQVKYRFIPGVI